MTSLLSGFGAMPKKDDEPTSPYLRRRLRSHEEVLLERAHGKTRPVRRNPPTIGASRDPADEASGDEQDGR